MERKENINEYYTYYLTLHQNPKTRLLHFVGQVVTIIFTVDTLYNGWWYLIPIIPFVIYPFAWIGHYFFEKNKPAAFSNPLYAKLSDWIMFKDIILGRLSIW